MSVLSRTRGLRPALLAAAGVAAGAIYAVPAIGAQDPANGVSIRDGNHISVGHNTDFIAAFGSYAPGSTLSIDVYRGAHRIAHAAGPAVSGIEGFSGGLEANHGPAGVPQPGDCWDTVTPDVRPGDKIVITDADGGEDSAYIDNITIGNIAAAGTDVVVTGVARDAFGTPFDAATLDSGAWRSVLDGGNRGGAPGQLTVDVAGNYTARYLASERWSQARGAPVDQNEVLTASHEFGYGHPLVPPPAEIQVVSGEAGALDVPGPALGCEGSPAAGPNAITTADDEFVNLSSSTLVLGGTAAPGVGAVEVTLSDGTTSVAGVVTGPDTSGLGDETNQGWTATFSRADLDTLVDGNLTATASFDGVEGGAPRSITKDTEAPGPVSASPAPGTYVGEQFVTLTPGTAGDVVRYRSNLDPTVRRSSGQQIRISQSQALTVTATDAAGNERAAQQFAYTINQPAPLPPAGQPATLAPATAPGSGSPAGSTGTAGSAVDLFTGPLALNRLTTTSRISRSRARNVGLRLVMRLQEGTEVVRVRIYRRLAGGKRKLLSSGFRSTGGKSGLFRMRQNHRSLRRSLIAGRYVVEVTPGASRTDLGETSRYNVRIVR